MKISNKTNKNPKKTTQKQQQTSTEQPTHHQSPNAIRGSGSTIKKSKMPASSGKPPTELSLQSTKKTERFINPHILPPYTLKNKKRRWNLKIRCFRPLKTDKWKFRPFKNKSA